MIRIRRTDDLELVEQLDLECFPADEPYAPDGRLWWAAWDRGEPVAFAGLRLLPAERAAYLCRAGVLERWRGHGLHRRLIRVRLAEARRTRCRSVVSYTSTRNHASANNLIRAGFKMYDPETAWAGYDVLYWRREL